MDRHAHSGLTNDACMPRKSDLIQLRWAGVNVDRRIAFYPETITVEEVLEEKNSERRRVLLDRYGYAKFLQDANAEVVDRDRDPGGRTAAVKNSLGG